jgi:hypothetical protein
MSTSIFKSHPVKINKKQLKQATASYENGLDSNETRSCFLDIHDINYLIKYYSDPKNLNGAQPINGFRIYFYREDENRQYSYYPEQKILKVGDKTQLSIVVVPVNNYRSLGPAKIAFEADDMFNPKDNDECLVLTPGGEHTGLCPTNCGR